MANRSRVDVANGFGTRLGLGLLAFSVGIASAACTPQWEEHSDYPLTVGAPDGEIVPYTQVGGLPLEMGFQGGTHLNIALFATDIEPATGLLCTVSLMDPDADDDAEPLTERTTHECEFSSSGHLAQTNSSGEAAPPRDGLAAFGLVHVVYDPDPLYSMEAIELRVLVQGLGDKIGRAWYQGPLLPPPLEEEEAFDEAFGGDSGDDA